MCSIIATASVKCRMNLGIGTGSFKGFSPQLQIQRASSQTHQNLKRNVKSDGNSRDWRVLELPEDSDQEQVRQAYLRLAKKYHPDSGTDDASSSKFQEIDRAYQNLQKKFADFRHNRHKIEGEFGLYYESKKAERERAKASEEEADDDEEPDIKHTAPQHRQYLSYDGIGVGTPAQREKQYAAYRAAKATENLHNHRIKKLEESGFGNVTDVALRKNTQESKKIKTGIGIDRLVEDLIQESMARGDFENLSGKGKPLDPSPSKQNPYIDFTTHKMNQMLIDNGFIPEWILLEKEIRQTILDLRKELNIYRHTHFGKTLSPEEEVKWKEWLNDGFKLKTEDLNSRISKYNLVVPCLFKQLIGFQVERESRKAIENFSEELHQTCIKNFQERQRNISAYEDSTVPKRGGGSSFIDMLVSAFKLS